MISDMQGVLGLASGALVGFSLGLVGGGGSILAVPLMVYVVGVPDAHVAIGYGAREGGEIGREVGADSVEQDEIVSGSVQLGEGQRTTHWVHLGADSLASLFAGVSGGVRFGGP